MLFNTANAALYALGDSEAILILEVVLIVDVIFNERKLVLGLLIVKVIMKKFRNSVILPELLDDL